MTDNELLEQFFHEARQMKVSDNGFSDMVMNRIPQSKTLELSTLWTLFCVFIATVLFVAFDGWQLMLNFLITVIKTTPTLNSLIMVSVSVGVVWLIAFMEILSRERYQLL